VIALVTEWQTATVASSAATKVRSRRDDAPGRSGRALESGSLARKVYGADVINDATAPL